MALGSSSGLVSRCSNSEPMEMQYVDIKAKSWRDMIALKAMDDPRLMRDNKHTMSEVTITHA